MSFDSATLLQLLPAIHRTRDAQWAETNGLERGPLEELIGVLAEQIGIADESLEQMYDDLFIETCADWIVPYIGDLIGYQTLHKLSSGLISQRAEVAHTIAMRRRKGTALVLEQLARDVTAWDARAVEYFQRLCTTQYMNHPRLHNLHSPDLRHGETLEWIGTAFETANRSIDVRHIDSGRGRHNIPGIGLHLWRIRACEHRESPGFRVAPRRYRVSPLNHDLPMYNRPLAEDDISHLAQPDNVPWPLSRRRLHKHLARFYGERADALAPLDNPSPSIILSVDETLIERNQIRVCNLSDEGGSWAHTPPPNGIYAIDPVLGRIALPADESQTAEVRLTWHEGFGADIGGGEYERGDSLPAPAESSNIVQVPGDQPTIAAALVQLAGDGVIEVTDSSRYNETLNIEVTAEGAVEIRASNGRRPILDLGGLTISGGENSACTLNGLLITGAPLDVPDAAGNDLAQLNLLHCTLVPGISLNPDGTAVQPGVPSLLLSISGLETFIERSITGAIRSHDRASFSAKICVIDANANDHIAFAGLNDDDPGAMLTLVDCTSIGKVHSSEVNLISNSILLAALTAADSWAVPVRSGRKQTGCVRFSWLPFESIVPRRHRCHPNSAENAMSIAPGFTSLLYGTPAYGQLTTTTPDEILRGADDESEMGVYHHLYGAQRETNLRIRLAEYLRVGLKAGIFYES